MNREFTQDLVELATYGHSEIDPSETVEVNLKDLMYVFSTLQEFQRFFHQPLHYETIDDVNTFLGSVSDNGGFKLLQTSIHEKMIKMIPGHIHELFSEGTFDSPKYPYYYREKPDET